MQIEVAAYGWLGAEWDAFYPEDLPPEWRLDYYANEFFAVVIPHQVWLSEPDEALLAWQEQVFAEFRFYWELPSDYGVVSARERLSRLRAQRPFEEHWGGVVDFSSAEGSSAGGEGLTVMRLAQVLELRPLREQMQQAMATAGGQLLMVVEGGAAASLRPARDLALLLGG